MNTAILIYGIPASVLTIALTEAIKYTKVPTRFIPLISIAVGVLVVCLGTLTLTVESVITGIIIGLTASGIYDVTKTTVAGK